MERHRSSAILALSVVAFVVPAISHASIPFWGPIIPQQYNVCAAGWGLVFEVINRIVQFSLTVAIAIIAPLYVTWAGVLLVTSGGSPGARQKAKDMLLSTVVGITVALSAWLIVDALMAALYHKEGKFTQNWYELLTITGEPCIPLKASLNQTDLGKNITGVGDDGSPIVAVGPGEAPAAEAAVRQQFAAAGVTVNHPTACNPYDMNGVINGCTNVGGMLPSTVTQVITIKQRCNCSVVVTGGSEAGHAQGTYSHGAGYKVDLGLNSGLNTFLQQLTLTGQRGGDSGGPIRKDSCGNEYVQESSHWDIKILGTCSL